MALMNGVIEHLCAREEHQVPKDVASPVIAYAGSWAYCPAGAVDLHDWRATGGRTLATVREWMGRPPAVQRDDDTDALKGALRR